MTPGLPSVRRKCSEPTALLVLLRHVTPQLGINYRGSVLARDDRDETASLRAGDRAPDAIGLVTANGQRRLFDLTRGGCFTLLDFSGIALTETLQFDLKTFTVVQHLAHPNDILDSEGHLARAYGAGDHTLVLIRPDGYIALISDVGDVSAVSLYLVGTIGEA